MGMILVLIKRVVRRTLSSLFFAPRRGLLVVPVLAVVALAGGAIFGVSTLLSAQGSINLAFASEMAVQGLDQNPATGQILLVLKEKAGNRRLAMVVGETEARTIFVELQGLRSERQEIYDLTREVVHQLGGRISYVIINHVSDTNFYAKVVVAADGRQLEVDSRPSHAVALAMRARAPIYVDRGVLDKAGIASPN